MLVQDDKKPSLAYDITKAVITAGLTAICTGLAEWGIDELRARFGKPREKEDE